jgi:hypothetical protein
MFKNPFKGVKKQAQRVGTETVKIVFTLNIKAAHIGTYHEVESGSVLSVCFERGGKLASSSDKVFSYDSNDKSEMKTFEFNESLALLATLYRDSKTHEYQEKKGKLILRQLKKSKLGSDVYKGLGFATLFLNDLIKDVVIEPKNLTLNLVGGLKNTSLEVQLSARFVGSGDDDAMSMMSGLSDQSEMLGANFDDDESSTSFRRTG